MIFYYTYVLKSKKDGWLYIGWTNDLRVRFQSHNAGEEKATRPRRPFELIYYEACQDKKDAIRREREIKTGFGRAYLKRRLAEFTTNAAIV